MWQVAIFLLLLSNAQATCIVKNHNGIDICVCNSTDCDTVPKLGNFSKLSLKIYRTSRLVPGFSVLQGNFFDAHENDAETYILEINSKVRHQKIFGFGGAFTDATGQNIRRLPKELQRKLMQSYFGEDGIEYNLCRIPLGGTDFSPRAYSLDDNDGDVALQKFALQQEDLNFKVGKFHNIIAL